MATAEELKAELAQLVEDYEAWRRQHRLHHPGQKPISATPRGRKVIVLILFLRANGYGSMMIARMLNGDEVFGGITVPTKRKGAKWHSWTVTKILNAVCEANPDLRELIESNCKRARAERGW